MIDWQDKSDPSHPMMMEDSYRSDVEEEEKDVQIHNHNCINIIDNIEESKQSVSQSQQPKSKSYEQVVLKEPLFWFHQ